MSPARIVKTHGSLRHYWHVPHEMARIKKQRNVVVIVVIMVIVAISIVIVMFLELLIVIVLATMVISLSYPRTTGHANVDTYGPRPCTWRRHRYRSRHQLLMVIVVALPYYGPCPC